MPVRRHLALSAGTSRFAAPPTARFVPAKAVGSFVPTLTKTAFQKFGFSTATLITDWARIAGAELAAYTMPDKLKWPRGAEGLAAEDDEGMRRGATLTLRVDPARALDVEYRARQIMDRINSYFGYRAVETIRLVQAPVETKQTASATKRETDRALAAWAKSPPAAGQTPATGVAQDDPLLAALTRLEQGVRRDQASRRLP